MHASFPCGVFSMATRTLKRQREKGSVFWKPEGELVPGGVQRLVSVRQETIQNGAFSAQRGLAPQTLQGCRGRVLGYFGQGVLLLQPEK